MGIFLKMLKDINKTRRQDKKRQVKNIWFLIKCNNPGTTVANYL